MVLVDLEALVAERVIDRLQLTNGRLEQVVRDAVDRELDRLIRDLDDANVDNRANGSRPELRTENGVQPAATKLCTSCRQEKPADKFERHRNVCRACRWQAERERRDRTERHEDPFDGNGSRATESPPAGSAG
jgi:hypothetical protein